MSNRPLSAFWLGRRPYPPIHDLMTSLVEARQQGAIHDVLLLLEHTPVITRGRGAQMANVLASPAQLAELDVMVVDTGRGGDVTLHAPGQLIAYPIFDLSPDRRDVRKYVQGLTRVMQGLLAPFGLEGGTVDKLIGLWLDRESPAAFPGEQAARDLAKVGAIGVRISRWVTSHGFALNLTTDLALFRLIVPCGISQHGVTSLAELTGQTLPPSEAAERAVRLFCEEFGRHHPGPRADLAELTTDALLGVVRELARTSHDQA